MDQNIKLNFPTSATVLAALAFSLLFLSCDLSGAGGGLGWDEPVVETRAVALTESPSADKLAAWYCPDAMGEAMCTPLVGDKPDESELLFRFDLPLDVSNTNSFPVPAVELLAVIDLFPGAQVQHLAAVCVSFCDAGETKCSGTKAGACSSDEPEINTLDDFANAAEDYLNLYVEDYVGGEVPPELKVRMIPANDTSSLHMAFDVAPDPLLQAMEKAFLDNIDDALAGDLSIEIPYSIEGALWVVIEGVGKIGINFGPISGEWAL